MKIFAIILIVAFLFGCRKSASDEVTKIELAKGTCYGTCVPMAISLDNSFNYKLYADSSWRIKPKKIIVKYRGIANNQIWVNLMKILDSVDFKHIDTSKKVKLPDDQQMELFIYFDHQVVKTTNVDDKTEKIIDLLESIGDKIKLSPTKDTLNFDTKLQVQYRNWLLRIHKRL